MESRVLDAHDPQYKVMLSPNRLGNVLVPVVAVLKQYKELTHSTFNTLAYRKDNAMTTPVQLKRHPPRRHKHNAIQRRCLAQKTGNLEANPWESKQKQHDHTDQTSA